MAGTKPNILFITSDHIGWFDLSAYNNGIMGYRTPNIDRIAKEGALFTDFYGQQSYTAGRADVPTVDSTVARFLKNLGYTTGQFGKNHLGGHNEHLSTGHGFDEYYGNLYDLDDQEEPAFRMGTVDEEFLGAALDFIDRKTTEKTPWFCCFNSTRTHALRLLKTASAVKTGPGLCPDGITELDDYVRHLLKKLDEVGVADNTIVCFTTDNRGEVLSCLDNGSGPIRREKAANWEGDLRVPFVMRWPGVIEPGTVITCVCSLQEMFRRLQRRPRAQSRGGGKEGLLHWWTAFQSTPART